MIAQRWDVAPRLVVATDGTGVDGCRPVHPVVEQARSAEELG